MLDRIKRLLGRDLGIKIAEPGNWFNTRYNYAEIFGGGVEKSESIRYGTMDCYHVNASPEEKSQLTSCHGNIKYDAVVRFCKHPGIHIYFREGEFTGLTRKYYPCMGGGTPNDEMGNDPSKSILGNAKPLINKMEEEVGRVIVDPRYFDGS